MEWKSYRAQFERKASTLGLSLEYVQRCLKYAEPIFQQGLPVIYDQKHFSHLVGYKVSYLRRASNGSEHFYRDFSIDKKSGGKRPISEPLPSLKEIQRWILDYILRECDVSRFAKAYKPGSSIRANARFHRNQEMVLRLDVKNYFGSIGYPKVFDFYKRLGYRESVATMLAHLSLYQGSLPQGAPTSSALSNLVVRRVDNRLAGYATKRSIRYTRYADDLTFSGSFTPGKLIQFVRGVLEEDGFKLNSSKTRLALSHQRQQVTGVVVNEKLQAPREERRKLRQQVYYIEKYGLESHLARTQNTHANHVRHLIGKANYILALNADDQDAKHALDVLHPYLNSENVGSRS